MVFPILYTGPSLPLSKLLLPMVGSGPHVIHGSLGPNKSTTQRESQSVQTFLQGLRSWQTDCATSVTIDRIYMRITAMQPMSMLLSSCQSHSQSSPVHLIKYTKCQMATNPRTKITDMASESASRLLPSFYCPLEGGRLSGARQCSNGVQPMPKAVHHSGCHDKHNCLRWDSNLGSRTPQSGMLALDHCDLQRHMGVNNFLRLLYY